MGDHGNDDSVEEQILHRTLLVINRTKGIPGLDIIWHEGIWAIRKGNIKRHIRRTVNTPDDTTKTINQVEDLISQSQGRFVVLGALPAMIRFLAKDIVSNRILISQPSVCQTCQKGFLED